MEIFRSKMDALLKDWLELVLSKPSIQNELLVQNQRMEFTRPELYKLKLELETRSKEVESLREQMEAAESEYQHWHEACGSARDRLDAHQRSGLTATHTVDNDRRHQESSVLKEVSRRSMELSDMMCSRCDTEMDRTRRTDELLMQEEERLAIQLKELGSISENLVSAQKMRNEYDSHLIEDFNVLVELMLTVDSLEKEVGSAKRVQTKSDRKAIRPKSKPKKDVMSDTAVEMQDRVSDLAHQLKCLAEQYSKEHESLQSHLTRTKQNKNSAKLKFQSEIKSLFTDFDFLRERVQRAESGLEKINLHYQLDEEELVNIIAPLVETIDSVRAQIDGLEQEVDGYFYNEDNNHQHPPQFSDTGVY